MCGRRAKEGRREVRKHIIAHIIRMKTVSIWAQGVLLCGVGILYMAACPLALPGLLGALGVQQSLVFFTHTLSGGGREPSSPRVVVMRMPLASALELVLNKYDVFDVDTLLVMLRSPHNIAQIADLTHRQQPQADRCDSAYSTCQRADRNCDSDGVRRWAQRCTAKCQRA